jgi:hypothetical protein
MRHFPTFNVPTGRQEGYFIVLVYDQERFTVQTTHLRGTFQSDITGCCAHTEVIEIGVSRASGNESDVLAGVDECDVSHDFYRTLTGRREFHHILSDASRNEKDCGKDRQSNF